jgi:copper resistance protein B
MRLYSARLITLIAVWVVLLASEVRADAEDDPILAKLMLNQLESRGVGSHSVDSRDAEAWTGKHLTKLWMKSEGERAFGRTEDAELQFLYSRAMATYWDFQLGVRHDFQPSPSRTWAAIGFKGLAPYFFEIDAALFIGDSGRTALRFEAEYELLLTQRLVLTPEIEANLHGKDDPAIGIGSGLSDIEAGLRLRFEIRREFAPYIGVNWSRLFGNTADFAITDGESTSDTQFTIGLRAWF